MKKTILERGQVIANQLDNWSRTYKYDAEDLYKALVDCTYYSIPESFSKFPRITVDESFINEVQVCLNNYKMFSIDDKIFIEQCFPGFRKISELFGIKYTRVS